jgi:ABC-type bacteriocin/lantibiotic exporter with double-glycine peptidase domain
VETIKLSELEKDLKFLRAGDQTEIGEQGINLTGGQKARIGLARAIYQDKDIYIMDNPISALDPCVRHQIINNVFFGKLKSRTRILVTHAIDFLRRSDLIILMEHGKIKAQGTFSQMQQHKDFSDLIKLNNFNQNFLNNLVSQ